MRNEVVLGRMGTQVQEFLESEKKGTVEISVTYHEKRRFGEFDTYRTDLRE